MPDPNPLAQRLLDAHVEFVLDELSGPRLDEVIARDVDDVLALADRLTVSDVLDPEHAKRALRRIVDALGTSPVVADLVGELSDALYDLAASEDHLLGEVIDRDRVDTLIGKLLAMPQLHDRVLERLAESPLVSDIAARFVNKIVSDFVAQNRQLAERLPGAKSLFALGSNAASRVVRSAPLLGGAAERGTQLAVRRTNSAMRDLLRDAPLREAALEVWDLHAGEPISELRGYLGRSDLRELALLVHAIVTTAGGTDYVGAALDECVDVFFARYGDGSVATLLAGLGVTRDDLVDELRRLVPPLVEAARRTGALDDFVRARLAPFYASDEVQRILARAT